MLACFGPQRDEHNFNHAGFVLFKFQLHRYKTSSMTEIKSTLKEFRSNVSTIVNDNDDDLTASNIKIKNILINRAWCTYFNYLDLRRTQ